MSNPGALVQDQWQVRGACQACAESDPPHSDAAERSLDRNVLGELPPKHRNDRTHEHAEHLCRRE